ncbi:galactose-1-phosphate uridylyltransferase [Wukongibacter baidiensis]|uniref:galactose-1-phosphate uridylyltransferase n=1 Tax=Wukongibacter baidiensis TaxID=1723361 RepID=UPI003D7F4D6F
MTQIRQDLFTDKMVIMATGRAKRPCDYKKTEEKKEIPEFRKCCVFCPGNEEIVPAEIERIERNGLWSVRAIPNKYPILNDEYEDECSHELYKCVMGQGFHEVIIDTYKHNGNFFNMEKEEFFDYLSILKSRYSKLKGKDNVQYISIFKNYLKRGGASLEHPHSQIITLPLISPDTAKEIANARAYFDKNGVSLHEYIIDYERSKNERVIHETESFIVMAPYASIYSNEVVIIYKHNNRFEDISTDAIEELSGILKILFEKMQNLLGNFPFNMFFHTHPLNLERIDFYRWHIHVTPKMGSMGGFETSTGIHVNSVRPKDIANHLKW